MNNNLKIEKAKARDFDTIIKIEEMSYKDPWPREVFLIDFLFNKSAHYFVAKIENKIVGFIGLWVEEKKLHIINITVHPNERCKGIGKNMVYFAINYAKENNLNEIYLEARKSNQSAIKLYESIGFMVLEELKEYYQDGEDGLRFLLNLGERK